MGGGDRAWWVIESIFLRSPDKEFWACPGDSPPDMPRRQANTRRLANVVLKLEFNYICTYVYSYSSQS